MQNYFLVRFRFFQGTSGHKHTLNGPLFASQCVHSLRSTCLPLSWVIAWPLLLSAKVEANLGLRHRPALDQQGVNLAVPVSDLLNTPRQVSSLDELAARASPYLLLATIKMETRLGEL